MNAGLVKCFFRKDSPHAAARILLVAIAAREQAVVAMKHRMSRAGSGVDAEIEPGNRWILRHQNRARDLHEFLDRRCFFLSQIEQFGFQRLRRSEVIFDLLQTGGSTKQLDYRFSFSRLACRRHVLMRDFHIR